MGEYSTFQLAFLKLLLAFLQLLRIAESKDTPLDLINPLIGTAAGGHVCPGASLPFGMAKAVADTDGENQGGFDSWGSVITGFSHMHDSGTGGGSSLGNFPIFPYAGCPGDDAKQCNFDINSRGIGWVNDSVKASPGYFSVRLQNSILAEMTVSNHSALYRFTFPDSPVVNSTSNHTKPHSADSETVPLSPLILVEMSDLSKGGKDTLVSVNPDTGRITGNGTFIPSFGEGDFKIHFCADFQGSKIRETGTYDGSQPRYAFTRFHAPTSNKILVRVGVSFISAQQACKNGETEVPDFDFDYLLSMAEEAWTRKLSGVIELETKGVSKDIEISFWSGIYRTLLSPQDYTGENSLWESDAPYYDSFYCIWDSFRTIHPFLTLYDPHIQSRMVRSLVDIYQHTGYLPDCRMSLCKGFTQGGSNADIVLVESFLKNITGVDWDTAYEALVKDAEVQPPNWDIEGRGGLDSWKNLNYLAMDDCKGQGLCTRSISRHVEYAYDDFCIAQMAREIGKTEDYEKYTNRSKNWVNLYKKDQKSSLNGKDTGFTGFLQARYLDGSWANQDPALCSPVVNPLDCFLNAGGHETYEGSSWLYTFYAPHDMNRLIDTLGGPEQFTSRLSYLHDNNLVEIGDEQAFLTVYQYHYAGRPGLSARQAHYYIPSRFNNSIAGIPGNDDSGSMGSFAALAMMGVYPVHGQNTYLITPPFFEEVRIRNADTGKTATIRNINFDPSYKAIYIQSAKRDGNRWTKNWITHDFFTEGGLLELTLGTDESSWGTKQEDLPPSLPDA